MKNNHALFLFLLAGVYFITRLVNLTALPIFNDEAMYINWGRLIAGSPNENLFVSLTDGQQPFFLWLTALAYWIGKTNFLFSGRLISVFSGFGTMLVLYFLGKEIFSKKIGLIASFLYILIPFALFYDRLAIKDGFLMFLASLILYGALKQNKSGKWKYVFFVGLVLGIALLTKSIAYFFVALYLLTVFLRPIKDRKFLFFTLKTLTALSIAFIIQSIQSLSPLSNQIGTKNAVFLMSPDELAKFPVQLFRNNIYSTILWWRQYYQLPVLLLGGFGLARLVKEKKFNLTFVLFSWIFLPISIEIFLAKIYIPRYFLFTFAPFSLITAYGIDFVLKKVKRNAVKAAVLLMIILPGLLLDWQILFKVEEAKLPQIERWQYIEGWPAGYGLENLADFIKNKYLNNNNKLIIVTEKETLVSSGMALFLEPYSGIEIRREFLLDKPLTEQSFPEIKGAGEKIMIFHHNQEIPKEWPVKEAAKILRFGNQKYFLVYELLEDKQK